MGNSQGGAKRQVFIGNYCHALSFNEFEMSTNGFIAVEDGKVEEFL